MGGGGGLYYFPKAEITKIPQTGGLKITDIYSVAVLEVRHVKSVSAGPYSRVELWVESACASY